MEMKKILSMAALALMGAVMTGCSSEDNIDNPQQPENKSNVETLTTTVSLGAKAGTRALDASGHKTFAVGDQIAVVYGNATISRDTKAVSAPLKSTDISADGKTATFTVTLENPIKKFDVFYVYPASFMLEDEGELKLNYDVLYSQQDGTLATLASKCDYSTSNGDWNDDNLPSLTLENMLAILALTLKDNAATPNDITSSIKKLTVSDGSNTYTVNRTPAAGPIYVAIKPTSNSTITVTATDGTNYYAKTLSTKQTYAQGNGYNVTWRMAENTLAKAIAADKGKLICTDGHIHAYGADAGCTKDRVAMIAYVGATGDATYSHGLALALEDANNGNYAVWCSQRADNCLMSQYDGSTMTNDMAGIANTDVLVGTSPHNHGDNAAKAARNYKYAATADAGAHPTGTSAWFLPSAGQWAKMATAAGGYIALRDGFSSVGGTKMRKEYYWSSTERNAIMAWFYNFEDDNNHPDGHWHIDGKDITVNFYVRACLAF